MRSLYKRVACVINRNESAPQHHQVHISQLGAKWIDPISVVPTHHWLFLIMAEWCKLIWIAPCSALTEIKENRDKMVQKHDYIILASPRSKAPSENKLPCVPYIQLTTQESGCPSPRASCPEPALGTCKVGGYLGLPAIQHKFCQWGIDSVRKVRK